VETHDRVLILMPTPGEGEQTSQSLVAAGLACAVCQDMAELCREIRRGAGTALLTEEAVESDGEGCLQSELRNQPPWSDFPLVVLAREGADGRIHLLRESINATLVEPPLKIRSLLSVLRAALRSRRHQYEVRDHLAEREQAEEASARLAAIVESSDDAIISKDLDGIIRSWNVGAEQIFGYTAAEAVGQPITLIIPLERREEEREILAKLRRGERVEHFETVRARKDGGRLDISLTISPIRNREGQVVGASKVARDISMRRRTEEALVRVTDESERRKRLYETALSSTPDLVYVFGLDHRFAYANEALLAMWGKSWDESIGKTWLELGYEPWHASMHDAEIEQVVTTKQPLRGEVPFHGTNGLRMYEYIFVPVLGATGEVEAVAGTTRDITDRKTVEDALREADRKKDDFIAMLAHELRNPLAPIRNGLQVMRLAPGDASAVASARGMMERQLGHMVRLIDDLLDVSRISRNKMELQRGRVRLADIVESAVETARPQIDAERHELTVTLPGNPVYLDADLTRLAQVFGNLLTNSAKYTPRGGRIWLSAERRGDMAVVSVRDTGIGIPANSLGNIFDMFSQVNRSIERSTGGLGIGLALVKGLVEMHGGTVSAASDGEGKGSTFTVTLPVLLDQTEQPTTTDNGQAMAGPRRRILVVDDNRDGADSLAMMLKLMGNEVRTANDGVSAIDAAEQLQPDVILMDVGMPRLNGLDATRQIREKPWGRDVTIIALTGWGQEGDRERSRRAGCDGHLVKPVDLPDLQKLLAEIERNGD
jgi:PAS domain S-box-containing protein